MRLMKYGFYVTIASCLIVLNAFLIIGLMLNVTGAKEMGSAAIRSYSDAEPIEDPSPEGSSQEEETEAELSEKERPERALLEVAPLRQHPELFNGCEITALTMLLNDYGVQKNKMDFTAELKKDPTALQVDAKGNIVYWGDPHVGFVGDITGKQKGLGVYHKPILELMSQYVSDPVNLTGESFETLEQYVAEGHPVLVWTTISFQVPRENQWFQWESPTGTVHATFQMHTVLMVGYDQDYVYVNDPETGEKAKKIKKDTFIQTWETMGKQALSYT